MSASTGILLTRRKLRECSTVGSDDMTAAEALSRMKWAPAATDGLPVVGRLQLSLFEGVGTCKGFIRFGNCKYGAMCKYKHCILPLASVDLDSHQQAATRGTGERITVVRDVSYAKLEKLLEARKVDSSMVVHLQLGWSDPVDPRDRDVSLPTLPPPAPPRVLWSLFAATKQLWEGGQGQGGVAEVGASQAIGADASSATPASSTVGPTLDRLPLVSLLLISTFCSDWTLSSLACISRGIAEALDEPLLWTERLQALWSWQAAQSSPRLSLDPAAVPCPPPPSFARPQVAMSMAAGPRKGKGKDGAWLRRTYFSLARATDWACKLRFLSEAQALRSLGVTAAHELAAGLGGLGLGAASSPPLRRTPHGSPGTALTWSDSLGLGGSLLLLGGPLGAASAQERSALSALANALGGGGSPVGGGAPSTSPALGMGMGMGMGNAVGRTVVGVAPVSKLRARDGGDSDEDEEDRSRTGSGSNGRRERRRSERDRPPTSPNGQGAGEVGSGGLVFRKEAVSRPTSAGKASGLKAAIGGGGGGSGGTTRSRTALTPALIALRGTLALLRPPLSLASPPAHDRSTARSARARDRALTWLTSTVLRSLGQPSPARLEARAGAEQLTDRLGLGGARGGGEGEQEEEEGGGEGEGARQFYQPAHLLPYALAGSSRAIACIGGGGGEWSDTTHQGVGGADTLPFGSVASAGLMAAAAAAGGPVLMSSAVGGAGGGAAHPSPVPLLPPMRGLGLASAHGTVRGGHAATGSQTGLTQHVVSMAVDRGRLACVDAGGTLRVYAPDGSRLAAGRASALASGADLCSLAFADMTLVTGHGDGSVVVSALGVSQAVRTASSIRFDPSALAQSAGAGGRADTTPRSSWPTRSGAYPAWTSVALVEDGSGVVVGRQPCGPGAATPGSLAMYSTDDAQLVRSFAFSGRVGPGDGVAGMPTHPQSPTVLASLAARTDAGSGASGEGSAGGFSSGAHLLLAGYSAGSLLLWDVRAGRPAIAVHPSAIAGGGRSGGVLTGALTAGIGSAQWGAALRVLHACGPLVLESRGLAPRASPHVLAESVAVSLPWVLAWDLRLPRAPFHAIDLGYNPDTHSADAAWVGDRQWENPFAYPPSDVGGLRGTGVGVGVCRLVTGLYADGDKVLMTHVHAHRGTPVRRVGRDRGRVGAAPPPTARHLNFHWHAADRAQVREAQAQTLHPMDTLYSHMAQSERPPRPCALDTSLLPAYAWPIGHGPADVLPVLSRLRREEARVGGQEEEEGGSGGEDQESEDESDEEGGGGREDFRFHLPRQADAQGRGFDPSALASMSALSTWHPHTLSHVGWACLPSATALAADSGITAVGGEQTLLFWHTQAGNAQAGVGEAGSLPPLASGGGGSGGLQTGQGPQGKAGKSPRDESRNVGIPAGRGSANLKSGRR